MGKLAKKIAPLLVVELDNLYELENELCMDHAFTVSDVLWVGALHIRIEHLQDAILACAEREQDCQCEGVMVQ